ncbi:discoidin domain-containing protein [Clostridium botulinum]|uniref:discoidin domain-containing protein n=1 Tax=Clostridium botulinum TaxID=1491 RepID=UPI003A808DC9
MRTYSENLIPKMTNNMTPSGECKSSSLYDNNYQAYKAFDKDNSNYYCWYTDSLNYGWIYYKFTDTKQIEKYTITSRNVINTGLPMGSPKNWTFEGSNNGIDWVILDTRMNEINWNNNEKREYYFKNNVKYLFYRLNISSSNNIKELGIGEIEMMERISTNKFLLKQNNQYYTIKSEFYKNSNYESITELKEKEILTQTDFETYGIDDLNLLTKPINIEVANGIDKGSLKSGKYFEIKLNNNFKKINDIDKISLTSITDDFSTKNNIFNVNSNDKGFYIDINDKMLKACAPDMYKNGKVTFTQKCKKIKFIYKITSKPWYVKFKIDGEESTLINTSEWNTFVKEFNEISTHNFEFYLIADGSSGWGTIYLDSITFDIPENNILMQYESQLYTLNENNIILSPLQTLDKDNFINNGFTDTDLITKNLLLNKFENLEEIKLLVYTDDLEKNKCEMIYNCESFRPIDKLKKNSDICNILFKEV